MKAFRSYWQNPSLASELSKEQRQKITDKFLKLLSKEKEKNAKWRSRVMKEQIQNLIHVVER